MLRRLHVLRARFAADQDAVLAEAVINAERAVEPLTPDERVVRDCDEYLGSIMMDGHLLTFSNNGLERINEFSNALEQVAATMDSASNTAADTSTNSCPGGIGGSMPVPRLTRCLA